MAEKEYISREAAIDSLVGEVKYRGWTIDYNVGLIKAKDIIETIPAADVREVVKKPVVGYEGLYFFTNDGEVTNADGSVMKQYVKKGCGTCYKSVSLYKDGQYKRKYVHRLVAEAFIPNPNSLPIINHKDEDGTNNKVDNLEWCTNQYNVNYGTARERQRQKIIGIKHTDEHNKKISDSMLAYHTDSPVRRAVYCVETNTVYRSAAEAARELGINESVVRMSCNRKSNKGRKYTFRDCTECGAEMKGKADGT
jgi:hypothetical protein